MQESIFPATKISRPESLEYIMGESDEIIQPYKQPHTKSSKKETSRINSTKKLTSGHNMPKGEDISQIKFSNEFWDNKIGTWKVLCKTPLDGHGLKSNVKHIHNLLTSNGKFQNMITSWLDTLFERNKKSQLVGKICKEVFIQPTIRVGSIKKLFGGNNNAVGQYIDELIDDLVSRGLLDATWEGKSIDEKSLTAPQPTTRLSPDFLLCQLLCSRYDAAEPMRNYEIFDDLKKRIDVVLLLIEDEHGFPIMIKNRHDSSINYLKDRWSLPYFFVTKNSYKKTGAENISKKAINEINDKIKAQIAGMDEKTPLDKVQSKTIMYLPPLQKGGNPIFGVDARIPNSRQTIEKINNFIQNDVEYRISQLDGQKSWDGLWNSFTSGSEKFHYGSILCLAHMAIRENKINKKHEEFSNFLKIHLKGEYNNCDYFDLLIASNPSPRQLFGIIK